MKNLTKFAKINTKVQELKREIAILEIELELLLLREFPSS